MYESGEAMATQLSREGKIPPVENLKGSPVYIHTGDLDKDIPEQNQSCVN